MKAMVLNEIGKPLVLTDRPIPQPQMEQALIKVLACGVCRTDLHLVDGELPNINTPIIPGHEIIGEVVSAGPEATVQPGMVVGIPWLGWTCGECEFCRIQKENLCENAKFTGYQLDGGYCEFTVVDHRYCIPLDNNIDVAKYAPLLCAGLIGYRSLKLANTINDHIEKIGIFGFGAAAHILAQILLYQGKSFYAFTRPGDKDSQQFAYDLGAEWAGSSDLQPPNLLDAAIIFAPVGSLVLRALKLVRKGGTVICGGIHMSDIPQFPYEILWGERQLCSVANLTRKDGREFFKIANEVKVNTHIQKYSLNDANAALDDLRNGKINGAAVLVN